MLSDLPADAEAAERLVAQRVGAAGRRALRYFHAEISTESNATTKYADSIMTNSKGEQFFYACDKYYGLSPSTPPLASLASTEEFAIEFSTNFTGPSVIIRFGAKIRAQTLA